MQIKYFFYLLFAGWCESIFGGVIYKYITAESEGTKNISYTQKKHKIFTKYLVNSKKSSKFARFFRSRGLTPV